MSDRKTVIRFFTIADYEEEEIWLNQKHKCGWKLIKMVPPCFYVFEKCTPEEVTYRLDYQNNSETGDYFQIFSDYGWEYIGHCIGWLYFRKPTTAMAAEQDGEIFSDNESRLDMIDHVLKTRFMPILIIFLCCVFPNIVRSAANGAPLLTVLFSVMALLIIYLMV